MTVETARLALQNSQVPAAVLVDIANNYPQLHTEIANHASAYPELLQWLANASPNEQARLAAANRLASAGSAPVPDGQTQSSVATQRDSDQQGGDDNDQAAVDGTGQQAADDSGGPGAGSVNGSKRKVWLIVAACMVVVVVGALVFTWLRPSGQSALGGVTLNRMQITGEPIVLDLPEETELAKIDPLKPYALLALDGPAEPVGGGDQESASIFIVHTVYRLDGDELVRETAFEDALAAELADDGERVCLPALYNGVVTASCVPNPEEGDGGPAIGFFYDLQTGEYSTLREPNLRYVMSLEDGQRIGFFSETTPVDSYSALENYGYDEGNSATIYGTVAVYDDGDTPIWESPDIEFSANGFYSTVNLALAETSGPYIFLPQIADVDSYEITQTHVIDTKNKEVFDPARGPALRFASIWPDEGSLRWALNIHHVEFVAPAVGSAELTTKPEYGAVPALADALQDFGYRRSYYPNPVLFSEMFTPQVLATFTDIEAALSDLQDLDSWHAAEEDNPPGTIARQILSDGTVLTASLASDWDPFTSLSAHDYITDLPEQFSGVTDVCNYGSVIVDSGKTLLCITEGEETILSAYRADDSAPIFKREITHSMIPTWTRIGTDNWVLVTDEEVLLMK